MGGVDRVPPAQRLAQAFGEVVLVSTFLGSERGRPTVGYAPTSKTQVRHDTTRDIVYQFILFCNVAHCGTLFVFLAESVTYVSIRI